MANMGGLKRAVDAWRSVGEALRACV